MTAYLLLRRRDAAYYHPLTASSYLDRVKGVVGVTHYVRTKRAIRPGFKCRLWLIMRVLRRAARVFTFPFDSLTIL